ncbi:MAG: hypothetical protein LUG52_03145 [Clostridia bacterium]|nr:hypothetical protein [Clostridia bacterium]
MTEEILEREKLNKGRLSEVTGNYAAHDNFVMRYALSVKGEKRKDGYDLFIALHGGGQCDTPEINNSQWEIMSRYYLGSVKNGIYVAPRGIADTWNTHFMPQSYALYKRLIENMIIFYGVNPNRVFLLGYSAGGDGVYQITPRMADYFAAANMSAGHPNGVSLVNVKNVPFYLQCGENDAAYGRNEVTREYANKKYVTKAFIHKGRGHQVSDNGEELCEMENGEICDTNAVRLVTQHTRNPYPEKIEWDLEYKTDDMFYYVESRAKKGLITVLRSDNIFTVTGEATALFINERFVDFAREVKVILNGKTLLFAPKHSEETVRETFLRRFDRELTFSCRLDLTEDET